LGDAPGGRADGGEIVPWFALQLYGCLRPNEAAQIAGNSEVMIRRHYLGRVTKEETARFFGIYPSASV